VDTWLKATAVRLSFCGQGGMALIPLGSGRFADDPDTRLGVNAMRHQNGVFMDF
jgi:hypothetical protein